MSDRLRKILIFTIGASILPALASIILQTFLSISFAGYCALFYIVTYFIFPKINKKYAFTNYEKVIVFSLLYLCITLVSVPLLGFLIS